MSVELLDCCRNILKTEDVNGLERVRECLCQSFFPSLLQTVIVSLFDLQSTFKDELLDSVQKVQKSAWDLERLICNLVDELDFGEWNVFLEMQITCTAALSKSYGEALCQSVQAHLLGPLESLSQLSLIRNGAITHSRLYLHVGHTLGKFRSFFIKYSFSLKSKLSLFLYYFMSHTLCILAQCSGTYEILNYPFRQDCCCFSAISDI